MASEYSLPEIFESILLILLLTVLIGASILYLNPNLPKIKLLNYELKNTQELMSKNNLELNYFLPDENIRVFNKDNKLILQEDKATTEQKTYSQNIKIIQEKNSLTLTS